MKRLLLLRHAKTEQADKDTPADSERRLTEHGREDAVLVGRAMRTKGYSADLILCSPSRRTQQTLELASSEWDVRAKAEIVSSIYAASAERLIRLFQGLPDSAGQVLVIGHNPGLEDAAGLLAADNRNSGPYTDELDEKFPTGALAVFDFDIARWAELAPQSGTLVDFIQPEAMKSA